MASPSLVRWGGLLAIVAQAAQGVQTPRFRPAVTLVTVDVRVFDSIGQPVPGLSQADFDLREDGRPRPIDVFAAPSAPPLIVRSGRDLRGSSRSFLLVLGRGRLDQNKAVVSSLKAFVSHQTAAGDRVGVAVFDRYTDLTRDADALVRLLDRYQERVGAIESRLALWLSGLTLRHWDGVTLAKWIQADVDAMFAGRGLPPLRRLPIAYAPDDDRYEALRGDVERLLRLTTSTEAGRARQDLTLLSTAIEYLRPLAGEKHLIFVADQVPRGELQIDRLARLAADARVTLSTMQTGGLPAQFSSENRGNPFPGRSMEELLWLEAFRGAAKTTGGTMTAYRPPAEQLSVIEARLDQAYVLGYYVDDTEQQGGAHTIEVRVNRPGVDVSHRRGYVVAPSGSAEPGEIVTRSRIRAAFEDPRTFDDVPVRVSATASGRRVSITVGIDARTYVRQVEPAADVVLDVAIAVGRSGRTSVGFAQGTVTLSLSAAVRDRVPLTFSRTVDLDRDPNGLEVKAVVYDRSRDRVGTAFVAIK